MSAPKRKFAFKAKPPKTVSAPAAESQPENSTGHKEAAIEVPSDDSMPPPQSTGYNSETIDIVGLRSERVLQPALDASDGVTHPASASIINVDDCTIDLRHRSSADSPLAKLQITKARRSIILCSYVSGSVFLSESQNCVVLATCGQMRLYKCESCTVYLHCTSEPVIEHSNGIKFAPLPGNLVSKSLFDPILLSSVIPLALRFFSHYSKSSARSQKSNANAYLDRPRNTTQKA